jgi:hypothetical protein
VTSPSPRNNSEQRRTTPANRLVDGWRHAVERTRETGIGVPLAVLAVIALFWVALRLANYAQQNAISPVEALVRIYGTGAAVLLTLVIAAASVWTIIERLGHTDKFFCPEAAARRQEADRPQPVFLEASGTTGSPAVPAARPLPPVVRDVPQAARPVPPAAETRNDGGVPATTAPVTVAQTSEADAAPKPAAAPERPARPTAAPARPGSEAPARPATAPRPAPAPAAQPAPAPAARPAPAGKTADKPAKGNLLAKGKATKSKAAKPKGRSA